MTAEHLRLDEARDKAAPWRLWGPYLSERQWGTVREDYSESGDAWNYFSHDQARSRAYRWGEDGIAGISDHKQRLCFALALWNGKDPILKERLFGLTNSEGNHGEDVKEYYFYLDSTPTHSYMKYSVQVPPVGIPVSGPGRDQPAPGQAGVRVRTPRYGRLRSGSLLRRVRRVCQGVAPMISSSGSASTTAVPSRPGSTSCRRSGFAIPGPGHRAASGPCSGGSRVRRPAR